MYNTQLNSSSLIKSLVETTGDRVIDITKQKKYRFLIDSLPREFFIDKIIYDISLVYIPEKVCLKIDLSKNKNICLYSLFVSDGLYLVFDKNISMETFSASFSDIIYTSASEVDVINGKYDSYFLVVNYGNK